jgi:extracellular elastinolytic metalloproteinase
MLLTLNRRLGVAPTRQIVFDALRLTAANPSFLDMRDDLLATAELLDQAGRLDRPLPELRSLLWEVFARFGMGPGARCQGAQLLGIVADRNVPHAAPDVRDDVAR